MVTMPSPPAWKKDAICTERGWRHPRTNELLVSRGFTAEEVEMYNNATAEAAHPAPPAPEPIVEVPVVHNDTAEVLVEVPEPAHTEESLDGMTKRELEDLGREHGIELDRRKSKKVLVEQMKGVLGI